MLEAAERRLAVVEHADQRRIERQMLDQHTDPAQRQLAAVVVQEVDLVETQEVRLYRARVLIEQAAEAT